MAFADLDLSRRLERAEGRSCLEFAEARGRLYPESGATWMECAGAYAVFEGVNSPVTQSFGLGLFEPLSPPALDRIEAFFLDRGAVVVHEVSPLAGVGHSTYCAPAVTGRSNRAACSTGPWNSRRRKPSQTE